MQVYNSDLYHWGVKGQKWGVRRYQNSDGSLTPAGKKRYSKSLYKEVNKGAKLTKDEESTALHVMKKVKSLMTDSEIDKIRKLNSEIDKRIKTETDNEDKIRDYAIKVGKKLYNEEMKRNGDAYPTERDKRKLLEYCTYDDGYTKAEKDHPEWFGGKTDRSFDALRDESKKIADRILGEYGDMKIKKLSTARTNTTLNDVVARSIRSLQSWDLK